ncbi:hypothetical protein [Corynebacterium sp. H78]|uniref:hypothetical protein n=1 Tax=Corynebacterium sp. H78 TaxID=3133417 RepID=UPI0030AFE048
MVNDRRGRGFGRDPFNEDQPTQYFGDDNQNTQFIGRDDQNTQYLGGNDPSGYNPDADFGGTDNPNETQIIGASGVGRDGSQGATRDANGQYWAPLSDDERGYDNTAAAGAVGAGAAGVGAAGAGSAAAYGQDNYDDGGKNSRRNNGSGSSRGVVIVAIAAIIALVVLVALILKFLSGSGNDGPEPTAPAPAPSSTSKTTETPEPPSRSLPSLPSLPSVPELPSDIPGQERLQDELSRLRETPPALPGLGDTSSGLGMIPSSVAGKSPATVEMELRVNGFKDVKIYDANGNLTNSLAAATGRVASIDPGEGTHVNLDTPVSIYLE